MKRLLKQLSKQQLFKLGGLTACSAGVSACDFVLVVLLAELVSTLASGGGVPIRNLVLSVITLAWMTSLARAGVNLWQSRLIYSIWGKLSNKLLTKLLYQPYIFHLNNDRNELSSRFHLELSQLRDNIIKPFIEAISSAVTTILLGSGLLWLTGKGSLLVLLVVLIGYGLQVLRLKSVMQHQKRRIIQAELKSNDLIHETFGNIRRLLLEGGQRTVLRQKNKLDDMIISNASWSNVLPHLPRHLVEPLGLSAVLLFLQIPSIRSNGSDALPWLALVTLGLLRLSQPMQNLSESYNRLQSGIPLLDDLLPLLELPLHSLPQEVSERLEWQELRLEGIYQKYPSNMESTLRKVNLTLNRGELIAIVGASGSGKSTLSGILIGLLTPDQGKILIDRRQLNLDNKYAWQMQCSEVSQPPKLLKESVKVNLGGWAEPESEVKLMKALEQVDLLHRVHKLPKGLDSLVGDQGQGWSSGEQQRLALASAVLRRPGLIILDEATSGVQEALAENLIHSLKNQPQRPAVVVITHRESIMECCERVVVMKEGTIVDDGIFPDLKRNCTELRTLLAQSNEHQSSINTDA
ncbi:ABC transporter ATP-binding protein/permease [Synechococcus sp. AH-736-G20]|nr:ABC transporter ATP-binding protein/permease [Synechococcus sp. AH-736-G20]